MPQATLKTATIDAYQWRKNRAANAQSLDEEPLPANIRRKRFFEGNGSFAIRTQDGDKTVGDTDWIVTMDDGRILVYSDDQFGDLFDLVVV